MSQRPFCDVCWGLDGKEDMLLQTCRTCGVRVHNECYGISGNIASQRNPQWECWACQSVGVKIKVRERNAANGNKRMKYKIKERPTECILCGVDDGMERIHAMHPVYDDLGLKGRQMVVPPSNGHSEKRLAWAHTLCCFAICAHVKTAGVVFGCQRDGTYEGDEDDDDNDDDESINSYLDVDPDDPSDTSIHHFVYCLPKKGKENPWTRCIAAQQKLKCQICGSDDRNPSSFRIPLQCNANDDTEFKEFKGCHPELGLDTCTVPLHVGCARWGHDNIDVCRLYYFPGTEKNERWVETVTNIFCTFHAEDVQKSKMGHSLNYVRNRYAGMRSLQAQAQAQEAAAALQLANKPASPKMPVLSQTELKKKAKPTALVTAADFQKRRPVNEEAASSGGLTILKGKTRRKLVDEIYEDFMRCLATKEEKWFVNQKFIAWNQKRLTKWKARALEGLTKKSFMKCYRQGRNRAFTEYGIIQVKNSYGATFKYFPEKKKVTVVGNIDGSAEKEEKEEEEEDWVDDPKQRICDDAIAEIIYRERNEMLHLDDVLVDVKSKLESKCEPDELKEIWEQITEKVFSYLEYTDVAVDWTFLVNGDGPGSEAWTMDEWDNYEELPPGTIIGEEV